MQKGVPISLCMVTCAYGTGVLVCWRRVWGGCGTEGRGWGEKCLQQRIWYVQVNKMHVTHHIHCPVCKCEAEMRVKQCSRGISGHRNVKQVFISVYVMSCSIKNSRFYLKQLSCFRPPYKPHENRVHWHARVKWVTITICLIKTSSNNMKILLWK